MYPSVNKFLGNSFSAMRVRVRAREIVRMIESESGIDDGKNRIVG
jgi:hypothetical protein